MSRLWLPTSLQDGCSFYRCLQPAKYDSHSTVWTELDKTPDFRSDNPGMLMVMRQCYPEHVRMLLDAKANGWTIVNDVDDNLWEVAPSNPAHALYGRPDIIRNLNVCFELSDLITASTRPLARIIEARVPQPVAVMANRIDLDYWRPAREPRLENKVVIAWAGSASHYDDLMLVAPALERIEALCPNVIFAFLGWMPAGLRLRRAFHQPWASLANYSRMLIAGAADIAILPLTDTVFNACKSNIKWMEFSLAGAACVASSVGPYRDAITHGTTGLLVENGPGQADRWVEALLSLVNDSERRYSIIAQASAEIREKYNASSGWAERKRVYAHFEAQATTAGA